METIAENPTKDENATKRYKVIIIGAGMAGLSAAYHLSKNGFNDYKILEARNRIGGRIVQIQMGDRNNPQPVELGANWIHGVLGNPIYELALQYGLVDIVHTPKPHKVIAATEAGKQVPFTILNEIYEAYLCFLRRCEEYYLSQYLPPDGIESVGEHLKLEIGLYLEKIKDSKERHLRSLLFDCLLKRETCISGCDSMDEIDLIELGTYTELQGGNIVLPNGYSSILEPIANEIPKNKLVLRCPVRTINWNSPEDINDNASDDSDKTVTDDERTSPQKSLVRIVCHNDEIYEAEHVICTIPLGVLKHNVDTLFDPPLPDYKREAIERLLFGTVDKILLEYDRPFLHSSISEILLLWENDTDKPEGQEENMSNTWYKKIYSFSKVSETVVLGWISGKEAEYMENLPKETISERCTHILRTFLNDPFIPKPKNVVCTSWHSQPYTRGSYTSIGVGASQIDIELLAQPLCIDENENFPAVLFAGEHIHGSFYSTVHGAYLTGRTAAQTLLMLDAPKEIVLDCEENTDISSWIQGICLE